MVASLDRFRTPAPKPLRLLVGVLAWRETSDKHGFRHRAAPACRFIGPSERLFFLKGYPKGKSGVAVVKADDGLAYRVPADFLAPADARVGA